MDQLVDHDLTGAAAFSMFPRCGGKVRLISRLAPVVA